MSQPRESAASSASGSPTGTPVAEDPTASRIRRRDDDPARTTGNIGDRVSAPQPLLASEALIDDLAPLEPAMQTARRWCLGAALLFSVLGVLPLMGLRPGGQVAALPAFVLSGIALVAALRSIPYQHRAFAMLALGLLAAMAGLSGAGPAADIGIDGGMWGGVRLLAATTLPAALLFRATYRAYSGARPILGVAMATALPLVAHEILTLALATDALLLQAGAVLALLAVVATLSGFMGSETPTVSWYTALGVVVGISVELGLRGLHMHPSVTSYPEVANVVDVLGLLTPPLAFGAVAGLSALGLFQLMAWRFARDARRIDLHRLPKDEPTPPSHRGQPSSADWSTRS